MYTMYMMYTIAEFRKHTRRILDEATMYTVYITRYNQKFRIVFEQDEPTATKPKPKPPPKVSTEQRVHEVTKDAVMPTTGLAYGQEPKPSMFDKSIGTCGHNLDSRGRCTVKKCKGTAK
jgi:hypothetical protein